MKMSTQAKHYSLCPKTVWLCLMAKKPSGKAIQFCPGLNILSLKICKYISQNWNTTYNNDTTCP